jgi:hypothetical protein
MYYVKKREKTREVMGGRRRIKSCKRMRGKDW